MTFLLTVLSLEDGTARSSDEGRPSEDCVTNPLYSFRYNGSAPAVYSNKLSEQVALSFLCTLVLHQPWNIVLFVIACVRVELG